MKIYFRSYSRSGHPCTHYFIKVGRIFTKWYRCQIFWKTDEDGVKYFQWDEVSYGRDMELSNEDTLPDWFMKFKHKGFSEKVEKELRKRNWL